MNFRDKLAYAVNSRNRTEMNNLYREMYEKYSLACFFESLRITGSRIMAYEITNKSFLLMYKRIFEVEDILLDLLYLVDKYSKEAINNKDSLECDYDNILKSLNISDVELDVFILGNIYNINFKHIAKRKNGNKGYIRNVYKSNTLKINQDDVLKALDYKENYDMVSGKIEMPDKNFFIREKKFMTVGIVMVCCAMLFLIIGFINAFIPRGNENISRALLYLAGGLFLIGLSLLMISSYKNKKSS